MNDCDALTDRMPEVARGLSTWTPAEAAHVAACADCTAAWHLVRAAGRIGAGRVPLEPALVAAGVRGRLASRRQDVRVLRRWSAVVGLAAAAAVALLLWPAPPRPAPGAVPVASEAGSVFLPELDSLSTGELQAVLESVDRPVGALRTLDSQGMGDLSDSELAGVLQSLEG